LISIVTRQQQLAMQLAVLSSMLPALLLSGFMSPIASMPKVVQVTTYAVPARYFLVAVRGIFLKGVQAQDIWPEIAALCVFAAVMLLASAGKFKTRID
ncbi:MAG: ABC transporter permease, partial [Deltaproteobacteria bacterium]|nr:ABC transporter permease [Deltaproteobacteria bacterium]